MNKRKIICAGNFCKLCSHFFQVSCLATSAPLGRRADMSRYVNRGSSLAMFLATLIASCLGVSGPCAAADSSTPTGWTKANMGSLVELYRHLHQTPELSL